MTPRDIACIELVELLTDYLEGALPADEVAAVDAHLETCAACRTYLAQMRATIQALGSVPVETLPTRPTTHCSQRFRTGSVTANQQ